MYGVGVILSLFLCSVLLVVLLFVRLLRYQYGRCEAWGCSIGALTFLMVTSKTRRRLEILYVQISSGGWEFFRGFTQSHLRGDLYT
jgi:4-amino-4-deoxy-L-arabinose transferase-like glycosyltransferase